MDDLDNFFDLSPTDKHPKREKSLNTTIGPDANFWSKQPSSFKSEQGSVASFKRTPLLGEDGRGRVDELDTKAKQGFPSSEVNSLNGEGRAGKNFTIIQNASHVSTSHRNSVKIANGKTNSLSECREDVQVDDESSWCQETERNGNLEDEKNELNKLENSEDFEISPEVWNPDSDGKGETLLPKENDDLTKLIGNVNLSNERKGKDEGKTDDDSVKLQEKRNQRAKDSELAYSKWLSKKNEMEKENYRRLKEGKEAERKKAKELKAKKAYDEWLSRHRRPPNLQKRRASASSNYRVVYYKDASSPPSPGMMNPEPWVGLD